MTFMYILVTILVVVTLWSLSENDKTHTVTTPAPAVEPVPAVNDAWDRVQRRLDRGCGTAVLPDITIDGEVKEVILAVNDQGAFLFMRRPDLPWVEIAHDDVATSDIVRWAKARWTALGGKA